MSAPKLLEGEVDLILAKLRADLPAALADVRTDRADAAVSTEPPQSGSYFNYYPAEAFHAPAVFVVGEVLDFQQATTQANTIAGKGTLTVATVVEDRDQARLTRKAFRYMAALHSILEQAVLVTADSKLKVHVRVVRAENGDSYTKADRKDDPETVFRREIALYCEVDHFENY